MKILLTGASGFIGKNIISHLFKKKKLSVIIISDNEDHPFFLNLKKKLNQKLLILTKKNFFKKKYEIDYVFFYHLQVIILFQIRYLMKIINF